MRLAVIGDTHLGYKYGTERGEDAFRNAADAFKKAESYNPDYIVLLGDIFDHRVEKPEVLSKAMALFKSLHSAPITIYGTHETRHKDAINPVQLLAQTGLVKLLHKNSIVLEKNGQRVAISGLSGVHDSFAKEELQQWNPQAVPGAFNIMLLHQTFREDIPMLKNILSYSDLPKFNLYLLGHIHDARERSIGGAPVLYPGSTVRTQLGKNTAAKLGFYILDIENNQLVKKEYVALDAPRDFIHIIHDIGDASPAEIIGTLVGKIEATGLQNKPLIKIKLIGKLKTGFSPSDLQLSSVLKRFKEACFLKIDKTSLESEQAKERLKFLADLGQKQESIENLGVELLCRNLKSSQLDKPKVAELFSRLSEGDLEAAEALLSIKDKSISSDAIGKVPIN